MTWTQRALFGFGFLALGYCALIYSNSWLYQRHELEEFDRSLASPSSDVKSHSPAVDGLIGRLDIARLGVSVILLEGTGTATLQRAVGHIEGTALPGQPGNVGFAGHRDTFFRPLRNIRQNDLIALTTVNGEYRYRVVSTRIVPPSQVDVLAPGKSEVLTLVTCYPFYYIGSAPDRFIVRAERIAPIQ